MMNDNLWNQLIARAEKEAKKVNPGWRNLRAGVNVGFKLREKGEPQTSAMWLSTNLTWIARSLRGSVGQLTAYIQFYKSDPKARDAMKLYNRRGQSEMGVLIAKAARLADQLDQLQSEIAEWNRTKKKYRLPDSDE